MIYNLNFFPAGEGIFVKTGKHRGLKLKQGVKNIALGQSRGQKNISNMDAVEKTIKKIKCQV